LEQRGAVLTLSQLGAVSGASAIFVCYISARAAILFAAIAVASMLFGVAWLENAPYERQTAKPAP